MNIESKLGDISYPYENMWISGKGGCNINLWGQMHITGRGGKEFFHLAEGGKNFFHAGEGGVKDFFCSSESYSQYFYLKYK